MSIQINKIIKLKGVPDSVTSYQTPRNYQVDDYKEHIKHEVSTNFSEVGTGKSMVSYLYTMHKLYEGKKVLVVMPPAILFQYYQNFKMFTGHTFTFEVLLKNLSKREDWLSKGIFPDVLMMSYQMFVKYAKQLEEYTVIVCDEAHVASNISTQAFQTLFYKRTRDGCEILMMTATPTPTELRNAYSYIKLKTPEVFTNIAEFDAQHVLYKYDENLRNNQIVGYQNTDILEDIINRKSIRRRQAQVLKLNEPNMIEHHVCMSDKHAEMYQRLVTEFILELGDEVIVAKNKSALRQYALKIITNIEDFSEGEIDDNPLSNLDYLVRNGGMVKFAVFVNFRTTVEKLARNFSDLNPALIYGGSNVEKEVKKFQGDDSCRIAILNYQSGGVGFNLQDVCHNVIFFESIGSPGMIQQALGRVQRSGQTKVVNAWFFRYHSTLSDRLLKKAKMRAVEIRQVLQDLDCFVDYLK